MHLHSFHRLASVCIDEWKSGRVPVRFRTRSLSFTCTVLIFYSSYEAHPHSSDLQVELNYFYRLRCLKSNQVPNLPIRFQTWWCKSHLHPSSSICVSLHIWVEIGEGSCSIRDQVTMGHVSVFIRRLWRVSPSLFRLCFRSILLDYAASNQIKHPIRPFYFRPGGARRIYIPASSMCFSLRRRMDVGEVTCSIRDQADSTAIHIGIFSDHNSHPTWGDFRSK